MADTEVASSPPGKVGTVRAVAGWTVLCVLLAALAFKLGLLDGLMIRRVQYLAQDKTEQWNNSWFGITLMQYPEDLMLYQELISELKPDFIVETGTALGGLTLYLASVLENVNPDGKIITVDLEPKHWEGTLAKIKGQPMARLLERIEFIAGSSTAPAVFDKIAAQVKGKNVLILLDSAHGKQHVLNELNLYSPLTPPGGYIIVNDTQLDHTWVLEYQAGPLAAVEEFVAGQKEFTIDRGRERFFLTCTASGFLKRSP